MKLYFVRWSSENFWSSKHAGKRINEKYEGFFDDADILKSR